jgi:hypothetical protein
MDSGLTLRVPRNDAQREARAPFKNATALTRPLATRVLRQVAVRGLFADVVLLVVAMALGRVAGNAGCATGALVALVLVRHGLDGFAQRFRHSLLHYIGRNVTVRTSFPTALSSAMPGNRVRLRRPEHSPLVPGIHVFAAASKERRGWPGRARP